MHEQTTESRGIIVLRKQSGDEVSWCVCNKGTHLITGAIMLNGVACGMVYRPLKVTARRPDMNTPASACAQRQPSDLEDKRYHVAAASSTLLSPCETALTDVRLKVSKSISRSMREVTDIVSPITEVSTPCTLEDFVSFSVGGPMFKC